MSELETTIRIKVDATNPGQFFACCGLLELADRLWKNAVGWFAEGEFHLLCSGTQESLIANIVSAEMRQLDMDDDTASPIEIGYPFRTLRLDWWLDALGGGKELKVWAGSMESVRIAYAMRDAMRDKRFFSPGLFNIGMVVFDPGNPKKKVEPFYFDARRGSNAHSRDVGFSANDLQMTTSAFPAVEFLCLVGLQRCVPVKSHHRVFDYFTWARPLPANVLPAAVTGHLPQVGSNGYRFENWFRTGQKKHKAFRSATPISKGELP